MKKAIVRIFMVIFMCIAALHISSKTETEVKAEARPEFMQDVPLDAVYFPDECFRENLKHYVDVNKDGVLSREEREKVYYFDVQTPYDGLDKKCLTAKKYLTIFV